MMAWDRVARARGMGFLGTMLLLPVRADFMRVFSSDGEFRVAFGI